MSEAKKNDAGKLRYDLIPPEPLRELARVYTIGAAKYADDNWKKGLARERVIAALMRHMEKYRAGEQIDAEDGQYHLSSVAWCAFTLLWYDLNSEALAGQADHERHLQVRRKWDAETERKLREATYSPVHDSISEALDAIAQNPSCGKVGCQTREHYHGDLPPSPRARNRVLD